MDEIKIVYEQLEALYEALNGEVKNMLDTMSSAKTIVNKLNNNDNWVGKGFDNYSSKFNAVTSNFNALCNDLYVLNNNIKTFISNYQKVDNDSKTNIRKM